MLKYLPTFSSIFHSLLLYFYFRWTNLKQHFHHNSIYHSPWCQLKKTQNMQIYSVPHLVITHQKRREWQSMFSFILFFYPVSDFGKTPISYCLSRKVTSSCVKKVSSSLLFYLNIQLLLQIQHVKNQIYCLSSFNQTRSLLQFPCFCQWHLSSSQSSWKMCSLDEWYNS